MKNFYFLGITEMPKEGEEINKEQKEAKRIVRSFLSQRDGHVSGRKYFLISEFIDYCLQKKPQTPTEWAEEAAKKCLGRKTD